MSLLLLFKGNTEYRDAIIAVGNAQSGWSTGSATQGWTMGNATQGWTTGKASNQ